MKALVFGATGYTGQGVVRCLREREIETLAHIRPGSSSLQGKRQIFEALGAKVVTTSWIEKSIATLLRREAPDLVSGLLGTTRKRSKEDGRTSAEGYEAVDYGLTKMVLEGIEKSGINTRFIYLSSLGADSSSPSPYLVARGKIEDHLKAGDIPYTIAQPCFITGPDREEDRKMERISSRVADGSLKVLRLFGATELADRYASMNADTLAKALIQAGLSSDCEGKTLDALSLRPLNSEV